MAMGEYVPGIGQVPSMGLCPGSQPLHDPVPLEVPNANPYHGLTEIVALSNPGMPGLYESMNLHKINTRARQALSRSTLDSGSYACSPVVQEPGSPGSVFKKALVLESGRLISEVASIEEIEAADVIVSTSGQVLKNRYGETTTSAASPWSAASPLIAPKHFQIEKMEQILSLLSGDFSHDNIAQAKQILKSVLGEAP